MSVDLLTVVSANGLITPGRGRSSYELIEHLPPIPPAYWAVKAEVRRRHDAVLVGTNTVVVNDPSLITHGASGGGIDGGIGGGGPVRATLDRSGRIPRSSRFFDGSAWTLIGVTGATPPDYLRFLEERGVEAVPCGMSGAEQATDLRAFLQGLEERGVRSVVCEGGGILNRALLEQRLVAEIHALVLPLILDGGSVNLFEGPGPPTLLALNGVERVGDAVLLTYRVT